MTKLKAAPKDSVGSRQGHLEAYFGHLAALGTELSASDDCSRELPITEAFARFLAMAEATKGSGNQIFFIGNGGSSAICSHMATDWMKNGNFRTLQFNDGAALTCLSNDYGYDHVFAKQIEVHGRSDDLLIAISSSGNSNSILNGVAAARRAHTSVITLSGFAPDNKLRFLGDLNFYVPSDSYGFVEISHLTICHCILDSSRGWLP